MTNGNGKPKSEEFLYSKRGLVPYTGEDLSPFARKSKPSRKKEPKEERPSHAPDFKRAVGKMFSPSRLRAIPRVQSVRRELDPRKVMEKKRKLYFTR